MKKAIYLDLLFLLFSNALFSQSIEDTLSSKKMKKDLEVFKNIRFKANSGLYKYRTKAEIDSTYKWAFNEIEKSKTYRDFYNITSNLTDYEGSVHNSNSFSEKMKKAIKQEKSGYFPLPIKLVEGKIIIIKCVYLLYCGFY